MIWLSLAFAGVDRVPQDFPTIQAAVSHGTGEVIEVGPGSWAGAKLTRKVVVRGVDATIDNGPRRGGYRMGFAVLPAGSGSVIEGFTFDCGGGAIDLGVYSSDQWEGVAHSVTVRENRVEGCFQGITITAPDDQLGGEDWTIEGNVFDSLTVWSHRGGHGGGFGVFAFNTIRTTVSHNRFLGAFLDEPGFSTASVGVAGCSDCLVAHNNFAMQGPEFHYRAVLDQGGVLAGSLPSYDLALIGNIAAIDAVPEGGSYLALDSVHAVGNVGRVQGTGR